MTGCSNEADDPSRGGAGNEIQDVMFTSHGQADYLVSGGGDFRDQLPADAALADVSAAFNMRIQTLR